MHDGALLLQRVCERGRGPVGAGYAKALRQKDLCQAAHADAADADEVYVNGVVELNLIHNETSDHECKMAFSYAYIIPIWGEKTNRNFNKMYGRGRTNPLNIVIIRKKRTAPTGAL